MRTKSFEYQKNEKEKSVRDIMVLNSNKSYIDGIDFQYLNEEEIEKVKEVQLNYERAIKEFTKKAFRRFSTVKIVEILGEANYPCNEEKE